MPGPMTARKRAMRRRQMFAAGEEVDGAGADAVDEDVDGGEVHGTGGSGELKVES